MINVSELKKSYSGNIVLNIPELKIQKGESFGLVGNNGAGKTTFFRLILDLILADSGYVEINGIKTPAESSWKHFTGSYIDEGFLIDFLTPEEYFDFIAGVYEISSDDKKRFLGSFEEFFNDEIQGKNKFIRDFSRGNKQKIGIAAALMSNPELLVLDEPFNSLDPTTQIRLKKILDNLNKEKEITMLISSHDLKHVTEVCDRIVILEQGNVVHDLQTTGATLQELENYFSV